MIRSAYSLIDLGFNTDAGMNRIFLPKDPEISSALGLAVLYNGGLHNRKGGYTDLLKAVMDKVADDYYKQVNKFEFKIRKSYCYFYQR
jgi:hypothetical protein